MYLVSCRQCLDSLMWSSEGKDEASDSGYRPANHAADGGDEGSNTTEPEPAVYLGLDPPLLPRFARFVTSETGTRAGCR